ncbi:MAG: TolC family protein [Candidatus Gastranaerophilaceae bacterium]|jgi:outer membrane protein TolC
MKIKTIINCIFATIILLYTQEVYAESSLLDLYNSFVEGLPAVQSYSLKAQALNFDTEGLSRSRFFNPTVSTVYSNYQSPDLRQFSIADLTLSNNIDIFNKLSVDINKNKLEIEKNKILKNIAKRIIFTSILDAYSSLVKNKYLLKVNKQSLEEIDKHIKIIKKCNEEGTLPDTELINWNIARLNLINEIENYKLEIFKAEETLKLHSKLKEIATEEIDLKKITAKEYPEISEEEFIKNSPEIASLNIDQKQLKLDIKKIKISPLPNLQISDTLEYNQDPTSYGNRNIAVAAMNFVLPNGTGKPRIKSLDNKIKGIDQDKEAQIMALKTIFRAKMREMDSQKFMLTNLDEAKCLSGKKLERLKIAYQKKLISYIVIATAIKDNELIQENYVAALANLNQNYEYLYHLSKGDIY